MRETHGPELREETEHAELAQEPSDECVAANLHPAQVAVGV